MEKKQQTFKEKLAAIRGEMQVPKTRKNTFGDFMYRNGEDIITALRPHLLKHRLTQKIDDDVVLIGDKYYIKAVVRVSDLDSDEYETTVGYAREPTNPKAKMDDSQTTGSTSSYARKFALNGMWQIEDVVDSDETNNKPPVKKVDAAPTKPRLTEDSLKKMLEAIAAGKKAAVKASLVKYDITPAQMEVLNKAMA